MDQNLLKQNHEELSFEYDQDAQNEELNTSFYEEGELQNGDLFDMSDDVEEIIPTTRTKPVEKKAKNPLDEITQAHINYDWAKQFVHKMDPKSIAWSPQYKGLSSSQKSKRKKESDKRKLRQRDLKALDRKKLTEEIWTQEKFNAAANRFLSHTLDDFKIKNDEEFAAHIQENFDLYHESLEMKNQLENVVSKKISVEPEMRQQILKQVGLFTQVGDWMTKKREVMLDKHYPLLMSSDLKDYKTILATLEQFMIGNEQFRDRFDDLCLFLRKVKAVDDCALNRKELTSSDTRKKAEMTRKLQDLANAYAGPEMTALSARERAFAEKTTREQWIRTAKEAIQSKSENPDLLKEEKYDKQKFEQTMKEFQELDLSALIFDSVEHILQQAGRNNELFRKGEKMHRLLAQAMMNGYVMETKDIDEIRARVFVLNEFKTAQTKLFDVLCTDKVKELEKQPCIEWAKANGVIKSTNAESRKEYIKTQYETERSQVETRIRESWKALKPDGQINDAEVDEIKKNYEKNLVFWERISYAKDELNQEDTANSLIMRTLCEEKRYGTEALGDKQLLYYLRGKSKEQIEDLLNRYNGATAEKIRLLKEIGDDTRAQLNEEAYEIKPDNAAGLLRDLNAKLSMADRIAQADRNIKTAEDLISVETAQGRNLPAELELKANWKKELLALKDFGTDHIKRRMDLITDLTKDPSALSHLAAFGLSDLFSLKSQRNQIRESLGHAGNSAGDQCAKKIFGAADALVKTQTEVGETVYGRKQLIASIQAPLNPVYQSYRLNLGLNSAANGFSEIEKGLYDQIDKIHADPAMSSREDLQKLRDLCINVLSDYVQDIPEEEFYDLPTPVLKELAMNRLKYRERTTDAVILAAIEEERDKGKKKELDPVEPEWSVKEKEALALISDLVDNKEAAENKEVRLANIRKILSTHAEILSDLARDKRDPQKAVTERKRYLELKELIGLTERIRTLSGYLLDPAHKKNLSELSESGEGDADMEAQIESDKRTLQARLAKEGKTLEELKNELNDLIRNIPAVRKLEDDARACETMEAEQIQLQIQQQRNEDRIGKLLKRNDAEEESIRSLEKRRTELFNTKDLNAGEILDREAGLQEDIEWYTNRLNPDLAALSDEEKKAYEGKKKGYEEKKKELEAELDSLKKSEAYQKALDRKAEVEKTEDYAALQAELSAARNRNELTQQELDKEQADRREIERNLKERAKALTDLRDMLEKEKTDFTPHTMDILDSMAQRLAVDSPEKKMVKTVDEALNRITEYLMGKTGDKAFKLKDIRNLIDNTEDAELNRLLETADQKIEETIKGTYDDISNIVQTSADFIFESIRDNAFDPTREFKYEYTYTVPVEAFQNAKYTEEDKQKDREKEEKLKNDEIVLKEELQKEYNELEKERLALDAKLNKDKPQEEKILIPKTFRQLELERTLSDYSAMNELLPMRVQWTRWNAERNVLAEQRKEEEKKKNKDKSKRDEGYVTIPKSKREQELDKLLEKKPERMQRLEAIVKPVEDSGAEGFYMRYAGPAFSNSYDPYSPHRKTLDEYYGDAWAPEDREEKKEGSLKSGAGEGVFVKTVVQNYFSQVNENSKRMMMTSLFRNLKPERRDPTHERTNNIRHAGMYLGGLLRGAGPLIQKLMQGVPEEYLSLEMKNAVEDVKSRLSPIPDAYIKQKFQEMMDRSEGKVTDIKKIRSLGAASVGQALLCELTLANGNTKQAVIKILRPGVKERMREEAAVIKDCAEMTSPGMKKTYEGQLQKINEELDLRIEAQNCRDAVTAYNDSSGLTATVRVMDEIPESEDYLLLDKADGITVDRYLSGLSRDIDKMSDDFYYVKKIPYTDKTMKMDVFKITRQNVGLKKTVRLKWIEMLNTIMKRQKNIQKMTELWIEESLFGKGFYHGDMHAGNIMVSDQKGTFLDYGNATKLTQNEVKNICAMNAAAMFKDATTFLDRFLQIIPKEQLDTLSGKSIEDADPDGSFEQLKRFTEMKNQIRQDLYEVFKLGKIENAGDRVFLALQVIQKYGIEIPIQIYSYCQSQLRLSNTLDELNRLEEVIRARISELDRANVEREEAHGDIVLKACRSGLNSSNPEEFYKSLSGVVRELDEKTFLEDINKFDEKSMAAFKSKYLSTPTVIDELFAGTHVVKGDYEDEDEVAPKLVYDVDKWEQEYKLWMQEFKSKKTEEERNALYDAEGSRGYKLREEIFNTTLCGPSSNGLMDDFGGNVKLGSTLYGAIHDGDEKAFASVMDIYKTYIKAAADAMTKYKRYVEKYAPKSGFFGFFSFKSEETPEKKKEREQEALEILKDLRTVQRGSAEKHEALYGITFDLNFDRLMETEVANPPEVYKYSDIGSAEARVFNIDTIDYTQLNTIRNQWKELHDKGDERSPEETERYNSLGKEMLKCYNMYLHTTQMMNNVQPTVERNLQTYYMLSGGDKLKEAYDRFIVARDRDIAARLKKWDDDTFWPEREKATKEFMDIYVKVAADKISEQAEAYREKVPVKYTEKIFDENLDEVDSQVNYGCILNRVLNKGGGVLGLTGNKLKLGMAIGMDKAKSYFDGRFKPGSDLFEDPAKLQKPVRKQA